METTFDLKKPGHIWITIFLFVRSLWCKAWTWMFSMKYDDLFLFLKEIALNSFLFLFLSVPPPPLPPRHSWLGRWICAIKKLERWDICFWLQTFVNYRFKLRMCEWQLEQHHLLNPQLIQNIWMEESLVSSQWLVTTCITPSFPFIFLIKNFQKT